jgi:hypothetical protein
VDSETASDFKNLLPWATTNTGQLKFPRITARIGDGEQSFYSFDLTNFGYLLIRTQRPRHLLDCAMSFAPDLTITLSGTFMKRKIPFKLACRMLRPAGL